MTEQKWTTTAGPIQTKRVVAAIRALRNEVGIQYEVTGVHDGRTAEQVVAAFQAAGGRLPDGKLDFRVSAYTQFPSTSTNQAAVDALRALGGAFEWTITPANHKAIIEQAMLVLPDLKAGRPITDKRITPAEDAERKASSAERNAAMAAREAAQNDATTAILAKMPSGAAALIYAEYREDGSWMQTDYSGHHTVGHYAIGWRYGKREDFKQLRAAAQAFLAVPRKDVVEQCPGGTDQHPCRHRGGAYSDYTPHYEGAGPHAVYAIVNGDEYGRITEHRDNYSMGEGNYLSDHGWGKSGTGWVIRSVNVGRDANGAPTLGYMHEQYIDALPTAVSQPAASGAPASEGVAIRPSTQREGYVEVVFPTKPDADTLAELKAAGFRFAFRSKCWYGPATALPSRYAVAA